MSIVIIGASSGPGRLLFEQLRDEAVEVIGIARSRPEQLTDGATSRFVEINANDSKALDDLVTDSTLLIHCSRPEILTAYLTLKPQLQRIIAVGSTRVYTKFPDDKCARVAAMSHALSMGDLPATILHPTMIYGAPGLNNIERIVKIAHLSPFIPLPENGTALIQPVYAADVVQAIKACIERPETIGKTIAVPGRQAISYKQFVELCIEYSGANCRVIGLPYSLMSILAPLTHILPGIPSITQDEVQRLLEDKDFDTEDLIDLLGTEPTDLRTGLKTLYRITGERLIKRFTSHLK